MQKSTEKIKMFSVLQGGLWMYHIVVYSLLLCVFVQDYV